MCVLGGTNSLVTATISVGGSAEVNIFKDIFFFPFKLFLIYARHGVLLLLGAVGD